MKSWRDLKDYIDTIPVVDTHEHYDGTTKPPEDIFSLLLGVVSAQRYGKRGRVQKKHSKRNYITKTFLLKRNVEFSLNILPQSNTTGYADAFARSLKISWNVDVTRQGLIEINERKK